MNLSANLRGLDRITDGLQKFGGTLAAPAAQAAAGALAAMLDETRRAHGLAAPLERQGDGARRAISANDAASIAREFGTLEQNENPWLAPSLPTARSPMRAAVATAVARALSTLRLNIR